MIEHQRLGARESAQAGERSGRRQACCSQALDRVPALHAIYSESRRTVSLWMMLGGDSGIVAPMPADTVVVPFG